MAQRAEQLRTARVFLAGAVCGFVAGAFLAAAVVWQFGATGAAVQTPANTASTAAPADDGLADVDAPVLESAERPKDPTSTPLPTTIGREPPKELAGRKLEIPVEGIKPEQLERTFEDRRSGTRLHEAIDILAPRNTPVKAVEDGKIARLFLSKAGGITIYQFDPSERFCYYYAHLERYAEGLKEGDTVRKGQVIGYVGTSGNAPKDTPHLHFAVFKLTSEKHWWEGTPIDPYDILR